MREFWEFLRSFWRTLISYITGGILAVFLTIWGFYAEHAPPTWVLWASLAAYFFVSAFGVWRRGHRRAIAAETKPETPPLEAARFNAIRDKIRNLDPRALKVLKDIVLHGSGNALIVAHGFDPWLALHQARLINRERPGHCELVPEVADIIKRIMETDIKKPEP